MTDSRRERRECEQFPGARPGKALLAIGIATLLLAVALPAAAETDLTPSPRGAEVYFISPAKGDTIEGTITIRFGLKGMGVAPAGVEKPATGHHHLVIDSNVISMSTPLPNNESHRHFGGGQTEVEIALPPGKHTLQLVLADYRHIPHDPPLLSEKIEITVREPTGTLPAPTLQ